MATTKKVTATPAAKAAPAAKVAPVTKAAPAPKATKSALKTTPAQVAPVKTVVKVNQEAVETIVKINTDVAKKGAEKVVAMGEEQFAAATKASADAYKGYEDVIAFSKSNIEAFVKSNEIFSNGFKEINSSIMQLAQANLEETVAVAQKLMGCKSVNEIVEIQSTVAKIQYEKVVAESRKISQQTVKLAESASKPIAERVTVAVETLSKPLAA